MDQTPTAFFTRPARPEKQIIELHGYELVDEQLHPLREYWFVLTRHGWLILACALATAICAGLYIYTRVPLFTADATVLIERKAPQFLKVQDARVDVNDYDYNNEFQKTQHEILKSRALAEQVIRREGLQNHKVFAAVKPTPRTSGLVEGALATLSEWFSGSSTIENKSNAPKPAGDPSPVVGTYLAMLEIKPVTGTSLVQIRFTTPDPALSSRLANAHALNYVRYGINVRSETNEQATQFLEQKLTELKERVEQSEASLNSYRRDKGIISVDDKENIVLARLLDLNKDLTAAEAERIGLEAQVRTLRRRKDAAVATVLNSAVVNSLKNELGKFEAEYAALSKEFKPGYPPLENLKARIDETRRRLQGETKNEISAIEAAFAAAKAKESDLRARVEEQKKSTLGLKDDAVQYAILAREVETNRQLYDAVLQRLKEIGVAADVRNSNVYILGKAQTPGGPSYPNKHRALLLGFLVGAAVGVAAAFLIEQLDNTLKSPEEAERYIHLPNLALVPDFLRLTGGSYGYVSRLINSAKAELPAPATTDSEHQLVLNHHPLSLVTEAYRSLRSSLLLSQPGSPPQTILITSAARAEGKTTTLVNTAIVFSQMGTRVLVVDADLRRPRCHSVLGVDRGVGLVEILAGQVPPAVAIQQTKASNLFLLSSGALPPNPAELLISNKMHELLEELRKQYEFIFIDSSPIMAVSDAVFLSTMVDGTLLVVDGKTPKQLVRKARARLTIPHPKILGIMLNRVDIRTGEYGKYYRQYYDYYHHELAAGA
jgi:capsular exopolysaccharide synthesis family protein